MKSTRVIDSNRLTLRRAHSIASGIVLAVTVLIVGCSTTSTQPVQLSSRAVVLETPVVAQDELYECGLVAISALCDYYRATLPPEEREELVRMAAEQKGLSGAQLRDELNRCGLDVFIFRGSLDDQPTGLMNHVDQGRPLIVMTSRDGLNHYNLFIGYDPELDSVVLIDPRRGRVVLPTKAFEQLWLAAEHFTLLAVPRPTPDIVNS